MKKLSLKNKCFVLKLLALFLTVGIVISSYNVCGALLAYKQSAIVYDDISSFAVVEDTKKEKNEKDDTPTPIKVDFGKLKSINPDIKGWLYNDAIGVNYPVLQGKDNTQYIKHLPTGAYSENGTLFFDFRNASGDKHILVYGHNMYDGSMFGKLQRYNNQEFYNQNPVFYFYDENNTYRLDVISAHYTNDTDFTYALGENLDIEEYVEYIKNNSCISTNAKYEKGDTIVTLSTCAYLKDGNRFVVHCVIEKI